MPPRRSLAVRAKAPSSFFEIGLKGRVAHNPKDEIQEKREPFWNRFTKKLYWLLTFYRRLKGPVAAYVCFLALFSVVVRSSQGGDDKMYLMVQNIIGQAEGGFDSTNYMEYPVTGKKNFGIRDIGNLDDFWEWMNPGQFIGVFFPESWCVRFQLLVPAPRPF